MNLKSTSNTNKKGQAEPKSADWEKKMAKNVKKVVEKEEVSLKSVVKVAGKKFANKKVEENVEKGKKEVTKVVKHAKKDRRGVQDNKYRSLVLKVGIKKASKMWAHKHDVVIARRARFAKVKVKNAIAREKAQAKANKIVKTNTKTQKS